MEQATEKQLKFASALGIENPEKYDKQALRGLIDVKLSEKGKEEPKQTEKVVQSSSGAFSDSKGKEYHLTPEQVRTNALELTSKLFGSTDDFQKFWATVDVI